MRIIDVTKLANAFPVAFLRPQSVICEEGVITFDASLTGYLHVSEVGKVTDVHAHYQSPEETTTVVHEHKGGRRAHDHLTDVV